MKKFAILAVLALAVACGLTACKKAEKETSAPVSQPDHIQIVADDSDVEMPTTQPVCGGWADSEDGVITDDAQKAFDKAMETYDADGMLYTPVSLLSTQVVAGTNYAFLCNGQSADAESAADDVTYKVVVYADLEGNASVTSVEEYTP